ncbi:Resolvase, holliday junction-type, YqgF-like [Syntrophomonas zehnderi OL-4]|uniref:Putative pre-16S rRNA nuclease n=1 Tax=Syntrophomonas zehnderi OL-4 TaxID=690567 RepID=A0A0E4C7X8_9FIRM|nr:Holliday junction resolvase RuvX [Syntrophomonas zehnderi]CFX16779.1 Resolvase, holliday junction-type, YqgF-like [Syntrophomonas zehnderi OL-4]
MRIMGLDVGDKRIGIAISDPLGWTAQGHSVLKRGKLNSDLELIADLCREFAIQQIVVGYPLNMNGTRGPKAQEVQEFGQTLGEYLQLPVDYWDERLSTVSAERVLISADVSRQKRKEVIDKMAAVHILQGYLDRLANQKFDKEVAERIE